MDLVEELAKAIAEAQGGSWPSMDEGWRDGFRRDARAILSRLDQLGLVVVPREPTEQMIAAGDLDDPTSAFEVKYLGHSAADVYRAMIDCAAGGGSKD